MHPATAFAWTDPGELHAFAAATGFARIFAMTPHGPRVAHAPVLVTGDVLRFHLANGNAVTPWLETAIALLLFEGPNAYLSANWYDDARGSVPSWNYVAVECEGPVTRLDHDALVALLDLAAATFEPRVGENWTRAKMEAPRFAAMTRAITGFEMRPTAWRGTRKLSQNKSASEASRVIAAMQRTAPAIAVAMRDARQ